MLPDVLGCALSRFNFLAGRRRRRRHRRRRRRRF